MAGDPFFRGPNATDLLVALEIQTAFDYYGANAAVAAASSIGQAQCVSFTAPASVVPPCGVLWTDDYVFVISGSTGNLTQWVFNVFLSGQVTNPVLPGKTNIYFTNGAQVQRGLFRSTLLDLAPGRKVVFVGFSLGAALCTLNSAVTLTLDGIGSACFAFAEPRIGDANYVRGYPGQNYLSLAVPGDPVPSIPPFIWSQFGSTFGLLPVPPLCFYSDQPPGYLVSPAGIITPGFEDLGNIAVVTAISNGTAFTYHNQTYYANSIRAGLPGTLTDPFEEIPEASQIDVVAPTTFVQSSETWQWPIPQTGFTPAIKGAFQMASALTLFFQNVNKLRGWTEVYYTTNSVSGANLDKFLQTGPNAFLGSRLNSICPQYQCFAARLSNVVTPGNPRSSVFKRLPSPISGTYPTSTLSETGEDCVVYEGYDAALLNKRQFHFRGIPTPDESADFVQPGGSLDLVLNGTKQTSFINVMIANQIIILSKRSTAFGPYQITGSQPLVQNQPITLNYLPATAIPAGTLFSIRGARQAPLLNGIWQAMGNSPGGQVQLSGSQRYQCPSVFQATIAAVAPNNFNLFSMSLIGGGTKKTGKVPFQQRGRRSAQLKHR